MAKAKNDQRNPQSCTLYPRPPSHSSAHGALPSRKLKSKLVFCASVATLWHFMQLELALGENVCSPGLGYGVGPSDGGLGPCV